jgi:hypothetical protein
LLELSGSPPGARRNRYIDACAIADYKKIMRKFIETTIGEIEKLFLEKIRVIDMNNFLLKILMLYLYFSIS